MKNERSEFMKLTETQFTIEVNVVEGSRIKTGKNPDGSEWSSKTCLLGFPKFAADENDQPQKIIGKVSVKTDVDLQPGRYKVLVKIGASTDRKSNQPQPSLRILKVLK